MVIASGTQLSESDFGVLHVMHISADKCCCAAVKTTALSPPLLSQTKQHGYATCRDSGNAAATSSNAMTSKKYSFPLILIASLATGRVCDNLNFMSQRPNETNHGYNMRIAEQIYDLVEHGKLTEAAEIVTKRQLDAMKEGARRAAQMARDTGWRYEPLQQRILTTAEQWTEKDL